MRFEMADGSSELKELSLPWTLPLTDWPAGTTVALGTRDRLVRADGRRYVLTSLPEERSRKAFSDLRVLADHALPVVAPVGLVADREGQPSLLATAWPEDAIPLEDALGGCAETADLAEALATLMVHLHLAGYEAGPSASRNPLILRTGARCRAVMSDFRYGALHDDLGEEQRASDLDASRMNLIRTTEAANQLRREAIDPERFAGETLAAYQRIWERISHACLFAEPGEINLQTRVVAADALAETTRDRLRREDETAALNLRVRARWEGCDHPLLLKLLTGLELRGERGLEVLRDVFRHIGWLEFSTGRKWPVALAAQRWVRDVYEPALASLSRLKTGERCH